ncbi:MAG: BrnT family toxin [Betaproteobacteria bacterium]|nr:MAG: BrnT family toxin [Betaproteobacteria bacterium]
MEISFDPVKNEKNIRQRGLSFERTAEFDFEGATFLVDDRREYGEVRYIAIGYLDRRLHILCFVSTTTGIRVVSFRKANAREATRYGKAQTLD